MVHSARSGFALRLPGTHLPAPLCARLSWGHGAGRSRHSMWSHAMSRFIQGDCEQVMSGFPSNAVDFILTDPPYLVGFTDRTGRTIANDKQGDWLLPVSKEMFRVLKPNSLAVSFYAWNRVDLFMQAWKAAGFRVVGHVVFSKTYASKSAFVGYRHESAYILAKGRPPLPEKPLPDVMPWQYTGNRHHPTENRCPCCGR